MLRKHIKILMFILIPYSFLVLPSNARIYFGNPMNCVLDNYGNDEFWFCGQLSSNSCSGTNVWKKNITHTYGHKGKTNIQGATYYCCTKDGYDAEGNEVVYSGSDKGRFVQGNEWIKGTKTITETFSGGGKCTWTQKINICGMVDNPEDKCTSPNNCDVGLVLRNGACVAPCDDGKNMAFASETSNTCVSCKTTKNQGIANHMCIQCNEQTEIFDGEQNTCVSKTDKFLIQTPLFDKCWLCYTQDSLRRCLQNVSDGSLEMPVECELDYSPVESNLK